MPLSQLRRAWPLVVTLLAVAPPAVAQASASEGTALSLPAHAYLSVALDSLRAASLRGPTTDWHAVRDSAFALAAGARRPDQTYGAIDWALRRVDRHSFLQAPFPWVNPELLPGRVGYLRVPAHTAGSSVALPDTLQKALRDFDAAGACGWIVDLRRNGGGNVWSMYAGIGPLLGDSTLAAIRTDGRLAASALYSDGEAIAVEPSGNRLVVARAERPHRMRHPEAPVAVLIDGATGSSGEAVAIAFRTRPNTRFFGQPTAGYTTANRGVRLADGANLVVTIEPMRDRHGREYSDRIVPDEEVAMPNGWWPSSVDAVARRAWHWLQEQPDCDDPD